MPIYVVVFGKLLLKSGYRDESAKDARRRIIEFFDAHLRVADTAEV
jgi:aryl-alcohol dehydrogenase-like predicted oxidoreductase